MTFLIDDEAALCRFLAVKTWTNEFVSQSEKDIQVKMRRQNDERISKSLLESLKVIKKNNRRSNQISVLAISA